MKPTIFFQFHPTPIQLVLFILIFVPCKKILIHCMNFCVPCQLGLRLFVCLNLELIINLILTLRCLITSLCILICLRLLEGLQFIFLVSCVLIFFLILVKTLMDVKISGLNCVIQISFLGLFIDTLEAMLNFLQINLTKH